MTTIVRTHHWHDADQFLPGAGTGYVITRCVNADKADFIYQAIYMGGKWEFWDEDYWPEHRLEEEGFKVTHWTCFPEMHI